ETYRYLLSVSSRESEVLKRLREETAALPNAQMQISPDLGQFLTMLVQLIRAKKTLEIGVFTGYSSLVVAQALPTGGQVIACDVSDEWTKIAQKYWKEAGIAYKISLRLAAALQTLDSLLKDVQGGSFEF